MSVLDVRLKRGDQRGFGLNGDLTIPHYHEDIVRLGIHPKAGAKHADFVNPSGAVHRVEEDYNCESCEEGGGVVRAINNTRSAPIAKEVVAPAILD